ncbi:hypothetical protein BHE74_00004705 [Ensete ventricosum]|nr:hypothetical protein GW17_00021873 [Ensete ventricosum]RWW86518.1 hypothetical protein BHE74_00004705 [Ensete ventricosum]RZR78048.1 hypothetical protein BHM03_00003280 [Ensete ventricosum]
MVRAGMYRCTDTRYASAYLWLGEEEKEGDVERVVEEQRKEKVKKREEEKKMEEEEKRKRNMRRKRAATMVRLANLSSFLMLIWIGATPFL